jgi:hypothetical protein
LWTVRFCIIILGKRRRLMPFDLKNLGKPARFMWPGDEKHEEWVELRILSDKQQIALMRDCGMEVRESFQPNPYTEKVERHDYTPMDLEKMDTFLDKAWDATIVAWNLRDPDGKKIACTAENKSKLMAGSEEFREWVDECIKEMHESREKRAKELEKNS